MNDMTQAVYLSEPPSLNLVEKIKVVVSTRIRPLLSLTEILYSL